jgi:hypothetical protein
MNRASTIPRLRYFATGIIQALTAECRMIGWDKRKPPAHLRQFRAMKCAYCVVRNCSAFRIQQYVIAYQLWSSISSSNTISRSSRSSGESVQSRYLIFTVNPLLCLRFVRNAGYNVNPVLRFAIPRLRYFLCWLSTTAGRRWDGGKGRDTRRSSTGLDG